MANFIYSLPLMGLCAVIMLGSISVAIISLLLTRWLKRQWPIFTDLQANDTFFNAAGLVFSLLLAFITVSVWENYQDTVSAVESEASTLNNLYQDTELLPASEREQIRGLLREYVRQVVDQEWPLMAIVKYDLKAAKLLANISNQIFSIKPQTESEKIMVRVLFEDIDKYRSFRMKRLLAITPALDTLMWSILILSTSIYLLYGCLIEIERIRRHASMVVMLSLTVGIVFILIAAYDRPFSRPLHFEPDPFVDLLRLWEPHTGSVPID